ncbi:MAG TPA: hypothetical protein VFV58_22345 [Blastocatellia bacterium]|jgi:hypothetical protein|nr:hypothetical protein [Blastocatellia bacterium]
MIYEMVVRCVQDLKVRWQDLADALVSLQGVLPPASASQKLKLGTLIGAIGKHIVTIDPTPQEDANGQLVTLATLLADARTALNGSRSLRVTATGLFMFDEVDATLRAALLPQPGQPVDQTVIDAVEFAQALLTDLRTHIDNCLREIEELTTTQGANASLGGINNSVENISAYPVLTQEAGYSGVPTSPWSNSPGARPLGQVVETTLRDVLGWRPKVADHKGFVAALTQSFTCKDIEGRTECSYTPRTYAVQVQADMGAVTGAQASIYARAKAALDQSTMILDRLYPLDPAADPQETEASRAIVRSEFTELVNELGIEGGPRVHRVDSLFEQLRGPNSTSFDPEQVQGQLRAMREKFGLERKRVNTIEEEQDLTDFLTMVDYVNSLFQSWTSQRQFFDRSSTVEPFLGTQLVLVSRQLAVVAESVHEVYYAMDSVFLGGAERQTIELVFTNPKRPSLFVSELLMWVERFATEEGTLLIRDAGKAGVKAFFPTIDRLFEAARDSRIPPQDPNRLPAAYSVARVQRSLAELETHLKRLADLARKFL